MPSNIGNPSFFTVEDNGEGAMSPPDQISLHYHYTVNTPQTGALRDQHCASGLTAPLFPIERGNIQVR